MMQTGELTRYLHENIPLTLAMGLTATAVSPERVELHLPLAENRNHKGTMFGGSLAALATLACWSLIHVRMRRDGLQGELVVTRSEMDYTSAVHSDCTGICNFEDERAWIRCRKMLARRGKARVPLACELQASAAIVGRFSGDFAIVG